jgi:hypothetical protein
VRADGVDVESFLHDRWLHWRAESLTTGILQNLERRRRCPQLAAAAPGRGMQRRLYRILLPSTRALHPVAVLRARLAHWGLVGQGLDLAAWFAELRLRQIAKLKLPATVFWSLLRLWCNALPTSRRFRNRVAVGACPHGCGSPGGDDIRHLAVCPLIFSAVLPIIGGANAWPVRTGLCSLFLVEPRDNSNEVILGAAMADTLVHTFLQFRRAPSPGMEAVRRAFNERLCILMQWSDRIRRAVLASREGNGLLAPLAA